jgi:hypothetical protein
LPTIRQDRSIRGCGALAIGVCGYTLDMPELRLQIVRFVDEHQPGFVDCEFTDADGQPHTIIDKVPVVSLEYLDARSTYPRPGAVRCQVLEQWRRADGVKVSRISLSDGIETVDGRSEFVVAASEVGGK